MSKKHAAVSELYSLSKRQIMLSYNILNLFFFFGNKYSIKPVFIGLLVIPSTSLVYILTKCNIENMFIPIYPNICKSCTKVIFINYYLRFVNEIIQNWTRIINVLFGMNV